MVGTCQHGMERSMLTWPSRIVSGLLAHPTPSWIGSERKEPSLKRLGLIRGTESAILNRESGDAESCDSNRARDSKVPLSIVRMRFGWRFWIDFLRFYCDSTFDSFFSLIIPELLAISDPRFQGSCGSRFCAARDLALSGARMQVQCEQLWVIPSFLDAHIASDFRIQLASDLSCDYYWIIHGFKLEALWLRFHWHSAISNGAILSNPTIRAPPHKNHVEHRNYNLGGWCIFGALLGSDNSYTTPSKGSRLD